MDAKEFYGSKVLELLPGQPSLGYPATKDEKLEVLEEKAENIAEIVLDSLIASIFNAADDFKISISRNKVVELIDKVWMEFKK